MTEAEIEQCHQNCERIMSKFARFTRETLQRRRGLEARQTPFKNEQSPMLELFNMLIVKNREDVKPGCKRNVERHYNVSVGLVDDQKPKTKTVLLDWLSESAREAGSESGPS